MNCEDLRKLETLMEVQNALVKQGFSEQFDTREGKIVALSAKKSYNPDDLLILCDWRFEGMTNPGDNMILYAIESKDGIKGTLVDNVGGPDNAQDPDLMQKIPMEKNIE
ncbi:MAG: phosphoribosylpyrophosphate synthetase [Flavobacteriaceae bacterium]|nr:phosphoribosylpyrophosphate synthetase [Flavobacteriaceae bacterium]